MEKGRRVRGDIRVVHAGAYICVSEYVPDGGSLIDLRQYFIVLSLNSKWVIAFLLLEVVIGLIVL